MTINCTLAVYSSVNVYFYLWCLDYSVLIASPVIYLLYWLSYCFYPLMSLRCYKSNKIGVIGNLRLLSYYLLDFTDL